LGTRTLVAPAAAAMMGYASNERHAYSTSSRAPRQVARTRCSASATEPQPVATRTTSTPNRPASFSRSATTAMSGYRWVFAAASAIASGTPGSGPYGTSLLASLMAPGTVRPGTYDGSASRSGRVRLTGVFLPSTVDNYGRGGPIV